MQVLRLYGPRIWQMQRFMCYCTAFALFYFEFEDNFRVQALGGLVVGGAIYWMFFCVMSLGDLYLERFIHGVAYFQNFTVFHVSKCTLAYLSRDQIYSHLYRQKFISIVIQALLYFVQCILSQRHQLISTIPSTVPLP